MAQIVILGAGLTGLSAAYHLEKNGFYDYALFEKESTVGGLCRSVEQDGFTFDLTGHLLHVSDDYFRTLLEDKIGLHHFNFIARRSFIYSHGVYTRYPFQINLYGLPADVIAQCIEGFVARTPHMKKNGSFYDWVEHQFGRGFGEQFFFPYQKKIFAYDLHNITSSWTGRFVPPTSLAQIIRGALEDSGDATVGYNATFFYPKYGGTFFWVSALARQISTPIRTNFCVQSIDLLNKRVTFENGHSEPYEQLINTLPLNSFLKLVKDAPATSVAKAADKLLCNSVLNFNLGVRRPDLSDKHWVYFPHEQYPFYRLGFPHNLSESMAPAGCSSLSGEIAYLGQKTEHTHQMLSDAIASAKNLLEISDDEVVTQKIIDIPHAYVIYDFWREKHLPQLLKTLEESSIYCVGRFGEWKYSSMQDAVLDGKRIASTLTVRPARSVVHVPRIRLRPTARMQDPAKN